MLMLQDRTTLQVHEHVVTIFKVTGTIMLQTCLYNIPYTKKLPDFYVNQSLQRTFGYIVKDFATVQVSDSRRLLSRVRGLTMHV